MRQGRTRNPDTAATPVVVVVGAPGAGKTTLGRALAPHLHAALIDRDTFLGPLAAVVLDQTGNDPNNLDSPTGQALSTAANRAGEDLTAQIVANGCPVVLVAPYPGRTTLGWRRRLDQIGAPIHVLWLDAPLALLRQRLTERAAPRDAAKLHDWDNYASQVPIGPPAGRHIRIDADTPTGWQLDVTLRALGVTPPDRATPHTWLHH